MTYNSVQYASLKGKHAIITGGATGLGAEMVRAYRQQGANVSFLDIDVRNAEELASETGATFFECDVTNIPALRETLGSIIERHGAPAVLINNAGKDDRHEMTEVDPAFWRRTLALNLDHQFFATQAVREAMAQAGGGSIIMLGSISWMRGRPGMVGYTTAKAAINGLTKTLARELGPDGIRVNCIVPGAIKTPRQEALWLTPELNQEFIDLQALKFRLDGTHVAKMAMFLGSDESQGATGANFVVDAGLTQN